MSDPIRLVVSSDASEVERSLLRSWEGERPSTGAREQTLAALGLGGAITAGAIAAGSSIAPKAIAAGWMVMAKWTAVGVVALSAAGLGTYALTHTTAGSSAATRVAPAVAVTAVAQPAETQAPILELPSTTTPHTAVRAAPPAASSLALQVAAVDRARSALDTGEPGRARRLVDAYESEYPAGAFTQEAEVVRIDALVREGNRAEAERAGKHFLGAYPKTPHAARVRALLGYDP